jgi:hypothetical protein
VQVGTVAFTAGDETMEVPEGVAHKFTKLRRRTAQVGGTYTSASGSSRGIFIGLTRRLRTATPKTLSPECVEGLFSQIRLQDRA